MNPKERAVAALTLGTPDMVPTFELEFQLEAEMFGKPFVPAHASPAALAAMTVRERDRTLHEMAEYIVSVYQQLEYSIIPGPYGVGDSRLFWEQGIVPEETAAIHRIIRKLVGNTMMIGYHGDGTIGIPDGDGMAELAYAMADDPDGVKERAEQMCSTAIRRNKRLAENGVDCLLLCSDYCLNTGPFMSPAAFDQYILPYLARIIEEARRDGLYTIKHTDGNIMPILDRLVACRPHALHSLDPMAGVDIKVVKDRVGSKVCLCGNVHCAALQTGTDEEVIASAEYCLTHAKPGGGYIFCTSNVPFRGMPPRRYGMILDVWKRMRAY